MPPVFGPFQHRRRRHACDPVRRRAAMHAFRLTARRNSLLRPAGILPRRLPGPAARQTRRRTSTRWHARRLLGRLGDHHAFSLRKPVSFDHDRQPEFCGVGFGFVRRVEPSIGRRGNGIGGAEILQVALRAFEPGSRRARPECLDTCSFETVPEPRHQRHFGADDDKVDFLRPRECHEAVEVGSYNGHAFADLGDARIARRAVELGDEEVASPPAPRPARAPDRRSRPRAPSWECLSRFDRVADGFGISSRKHRLPISSSSHEWKPSPVPTFPNSASARSRAVALKRTRGGHVSFCAGAGRDQRPQIPFLGARLFRPQGRQGRVLNAVIWRGTAQKLEGQTAAGSGSRLHGPDFHLCRLFALPDHCRTGRAGRPRCALATRPCWRRSARSASPPKVSSRPSGKDALALSAGCDRRRDVAHRRSHSRHHASAVGTLSPPCTLVARRGAGRAGGQRNRCCYPRF